MLRRTLTGLALAVAMVWGSSASAMTSVEGTAIGDQGFYWTTPAEVWIFPHRIGNIDNRVMLQWHDASGGSPTGNPPIVYNIDGLMTGSGVVSSIQGNAGGGFVLELIKDLNLGLWLSGYDPGHNAFVGRGVTATGWDTYNDGINDVQGADTSLVPLGRDAIEAGRKVDLFASYWLSDLDIEAGLRFWYGSASISNLPDEWNGPVDIDTDSDPATDRDPANPFNGRDESLAIDTSSYGVSDLGFGLGAGWRGMEGFRADLGFNINLLGVGWEPNGINNYVDIGGSAFSVNARSHFDLSNEWTVGGFARFATSSMGLEPQLQRDGGDLYPLFTSGVADDLHSLPNPTAAAPSQRDPALPSNTGEVVSQNSKYEEGAMQVQIAGLVQYRPMSRAKLYGAFGFRRRAFTQKTSVGNIWSHEVASSWMTLPFIHLGAEGKVFSWLDLFLGASKQWRGQTTVTTSTDTRIPSDGQFGPALPAQAPPAGSEDATNANRRELKTETYQNTQLTSTTSLFLGARMHYQAFSLMAHINPDWLLSGTYMLSGASAGDTFAWLSLIYDWDWDTDVKYGNGTQMYTADAATSPHHAEPAPARDELGHDRSYTPAPAPAPAPAPEPEPEPEYEEFDS